jgi:hypothetical protein
LKPSQFLFHFNTFSEFCLFLELDACGVLTMGMTLAADLLSRPLNKSAKNREAPQDYGRSNKLLYSVIHYVLDRQQN